MNNFLNENQQLRRRFEFCEAGEISTAKCKSGFVYKTMLFLILTPKTPREKGHQILSVKSFIQISIILVSKAKSVKLLHKGNCLLKQILFG